MTPGEETRGSRVKGVHEWHRWFRYFLEPAALVPIACVYDKLCEAALVSCTYIACMFDSRALERLDLR